MLAGSYFGQGYFGDYPPAGVAELPTVALVEIAGTRSDFRRGSISIQDVLGQTPKSATLRTDGQQTQGRLVKIGLGDLTPPNLIFGGEFNDVKQTFESIPANIVYDNTVIDQSFRANRRLVWKSYTNVDASVALVDIVTTYCPANTANGVQASLGLVTISFQGSTVDVAISTIMTLVGGYWEWSYTGDLSAYLTNPTNQNPDTLDSNNTALLKDPPLQYESDLSQIRTRSIVVGAGSTLKSAVSVGETILPVNDSTVFDVGGGTAELGAQRLAYVGKDVGGVGTLIGPGITPSAALSAVVSNGTGIEAGVHQYAFTWVTASGETLTSPLASITNGVIADPPSATLSADLSTWSDVNVDVGDVLQIFLQLGLRDPATGGTAGYSNIVSGGTITVPNWSGIGTHAALINYAVTIPAVMIGSSLAQFYLFVYVTKNGGSYIEASVAETYIPRTGASLNRGLTSGAWTSYTSRTPAPNLEQAALSSIAVGPSGVTKRKIYRTTAGGSQLKLLSTINDNTTTTWTDSTADASLGANAPSSDTSALTQPTGQVLAGSTTLPVAGPSAFNVAGGWAIAASQVIRYTGISGTTLTGIPASGLGAILATLNYNTTITTSPSLTGVSGLVYAALQGDTISLLVQRDSVAGQAALGALELDASGSATDGVHENVIRDSTLLSSTACAARGDADLALFQFALVTITYDTRDLKTRSGRAITTNLPAQVPNGTYLITSVTITEIDIADGLAPRFSVTASSSRFSLEDLLRHVLTTR